jgi:SPP1 gp7 family putative phage head morphogenesis protein
MLRQRFMADMRRRFAALRAAITALVDTEDAFGLRADAVAGRGPFAPILAAVVSVWPQEALNAQAITINVVRRVGGKWYVYGEGGKKLSKGYASKAAAIRRLRQIEYFKHRGTTTNTFTINTRWRFVADDAKLDSYRQWLKAQVNAGILEVSGVNKQTPWVESYISSAYKKGLLRAYTDTHAADIAAARGFEFIEGGKAGFLDMAFNSPVAQSKLKMLWTRAFSQLQGVTAQMDQEMSRILTSGLAAGTGPRQIARELNKSVSGLEKKRALTIARTEIINAHAEGQLDAFDVMNVEEVGVMAEWSTAGDDRVCPLCAPLEGVVMTVKEARGLIPRHPNCVAGDMRVVAPGALAMLKTYYTGEIIDFTTVGGRHITVTPAHILLTKYGFARAESIYNGLDLVVDTGCYGGIEAPDYKHGVPCIADEFIAAFEALNMLAVCVPTAPEYLHHEGRFCNEKIDIIFADGVLGNCGQSYPRQTSLDGALPFCTGGLPGPALGAFTQRLRCMAHAADSSMGGCRDALALLLGGVLEAEQIRLGTSAGCQSPIRQSFQDYAPVSTQLFRDCLDRHPILKKFNDCPCIDFDAVLTGRILDWATHFIEAGFDGIPFDMVMFGNAVEGPSVDSVQFDKVLSIRRRHVCSFPVYDLQTMSTVYSISGIIASNCRCSWQPANVGEKKTGQKRAKSSKVKAITKSIKAETGKKTKKAALLASSWAGKP